ncbi:hypothetical protein ACJ41O_012421 [Fusarium nematophilum]
MESRSSLVLPPHLRGSRAVSSSTELRPRLSAARSSLALPTRIQQANQSRALDDANLGPPSDSYTLLTVFAFISENPSLVALGVSLRSPFSVTGRGRTYEVRRYSEGTTQDIDDFDHWRPSRAHKHLNCASLGRSGGDAATSMAYRSLVNELRILTHKPLSTHPNLLRIMGLGWSAPESDPDYYLPMVQTEFAPFGTLKTFLSAWHCPYSFKRQFLLDIAEGLSALHGCSIVHGDVKVENILIFVSEDPEYPFIAKISDFGFSLDTSPEGTGHLIGCTPLWAAPEAADTIPYSEMHLTDVYSLGFTVWAVALNGQSPFEILPGLPDDPYLRYEAFKFLKATDDMDAAAVRCFLETPDRDNDLDLPELFDLFRSLLRFDTKERSLAYVVERLGSGSHREDHDSLSRSWVSLPRLDLEKVRHPQYPKTDLVFFAHLSARNNQTNISASVLGNYQIPILSQLQSQLEVIARHIVDRRSPVSKDDIKDGDPTAAWRYPSKFCSRQAGAAFSLFTIHFHGYGAPQSLSNAMEWLRISAENGYTFAMALCAKLNDQFKIGLSPETGRSWMILSAGNGSKPAMAALKAKDPSAYSQSRQFYRTKFWAHCYGLSDEIICQLQTTTDISGSNWDPRCSRSRYGDNLLHCAALTGSEAAARLCLAAHRMDINAVNQRGETAFFLACRTGNSAMVDLLLSQGANPLICNMYAESGMHWLDSFEDKDILEYATKFIELGLDLHQDAQLDESLADVAARQYFHRLVAGTPLHRAVEAGNTLLVGILLDLGADACHMVGQLLNRPLSRDIVNIAQSAKSAGVSFTLLQRAISEKKESPLHFYINDDYSEDAVRRVLGALVQNGAKLTGGSHDSLYLALARRNATVVDFLLSSGYGHIERHIQLSAVSTVAPLALAVIMGDVDLVTVLLRHGADPEGSMQFHDTIVPCLILNIKAGQAFNRLAISKALVSAGADVDRLLPGDDRDGPLSRALSQNHFRQANLLIEKGARLQFSAASFQRKTVLKLLSINNTLDWSMYRACEFLIQHPQACLPLWTVVGMQTVFHSLFMAKEIRRRNIDPDNIRAIFGLLRQQFPDMETLNMRDASGHTALHHAVYNANSAGVRLLVEAGCDPSDKVTPVMGTVQSLFATGTEGSQLDLLTRSIVHEQD